MTIAAQCARVRLRRRMGTLLTLLALVGPVAEKDAEAFDRFPGCDTFLVLMTEGQSEPRVGQINRICPAGRAAAWKPANVCETGDRHRIDNLVSVVGSTSGHKLEGRSSKLWRGFEFYGSE